MDPGAAGEGFPAVQFTGGATVLVELNLDIHICGLCKQQYNNLDAFVAHKQSGCQLTNSATGTVQFVTEETVPQTQASRTITSETQTITVSAPEFVFEHGYQTFLPSHSSESQTAGTLPIPTKCQSRKVTSSLGPRKQSCHYEGCPFKTAYGMKDMERHLRTHTGDKPHKCELCEKCFSRKDKLKTHVRSHTGEKPYKCKECDYTAADSSSMCKHQRIHTNERPFKCQICPYASRNSSQLTVHLRSHTVTGGATVLVELNLDIHICGLCKQQYNNLDAFVAHKQSGCQLTNSATGTVQFVTEETVPQTQASRTITSETQTITVSAPEFVFEHGYQTFLPSHSSESQTAGTLPIPTKCQSRKVTSSLGPRKQSCHYEGCPFKTAYGMKDMERHLRTHTGDKPHKCELCEKCFSRKDKLKTHVRSHTGEKPYKCKECDYTAADSSSMCKHQRIHTNERPFKCQICPYASRNSSQLTVHLRSHTGDAPFLCFLCNAKFKINSDLKRHMRVHTGEKPYKCEFCDFFCAMKGNLKSHIRMKHNSGKAIKCLQCDFQCGSKSVLQQHARTHLPEQPVKCMECTYSCATRAALKVHERIHSKDRPFKCNFCNFDTKQRSNLTTHIKKYHRDKVKPKKSSMDKKEGDTARHSSRQGGKLSAKRSFRCELCEASFVREDSLRSHKKQHEEYNIQNQSEAAILQLQINQSRQNSSVVSVGHIQVPIQANEIALYSDGGVKTIVGHPVSERNTVETISLTAGSPNVIADIKEDMANTQLQMLSQVSLVATSQSIKSESDTPSIAQHGIHLNTEDHNSGHTLHQSLIHTGEDNSQEPPSSQTFLASSSMNSMDLDGLSDLIEEGTTEVTVVSDAGDNIPVSEPSPIYSTSSPVEEAKQDYTIIPRDSHSASLCPADSIPD